MAIQDPNRPLTGKIVNPRPGMGALPNMPQPAAVRPVPVAGMGAGVYPPLQPVGMGAGVHPPTGTFVGTHPPLQPPVGMGAGVHPPTGTFVGTHPPLQPAGMGGGVHPPNGPFVGTHPPLEPPPPNKGVTLRPTPGVGVMPPQMGTAPPLKSAVTRAGESALHAGRGVRAAANGTMGKLGVLGAGVMGAVDAYTDDATDRYAERFAMAPPTYDGSPEDIAKQVTLRGLGFASEMGNAATFGLASNLYRDRQRQASEAEARQTAAGAAATAKEAQAKAEAVKTAQNAANPAVAKLAGEDMGDGVRRVSTNGTTLFTNATTDKADQNLMTRAAPVQPGLTPEQQKFNQDNFITSPISNNKLGRGLVSTVGNMGETNAINERALKVMKEMRGMREGQMDHGDIYAYADRAGQQPGGINQELARQIRRLSGNGGRLSAGANQALAGMLNIQAQMRGQDMEAQDRQGAARQAGMNAQQKMAQDEREFGLKVADFGLRSQAEQRQAAGTKAEIGSKVQADDNAMAARRQKGREDMLNEFRGRYTKNTMTGGKEVDEQAAQGAMQGVTTWIGKQQAQLQAKVAKGEATPAEQARLAKMDSQSLSGLDEADRVNVEFLLNMKQRVKEAAGRLGGGTFNDDPDLGGYEIEGIEDDPRFFGSRMYKLKNGSTVRENDLKFAEGPGNRILPDIQGGGFLDEKKTKTAKFDLATKGFRP